MRSLEAGGIGTFILNIYRKMDTSKIQFDFAITHRGMGQYGEEIQKRGGNIYFISENGNSNILDGVIQLKNLYGLIRANCYNVVHSHYYFANAYFLGVAKMAGVPIRVSHCHNTRTKKVGICKKAFECLSRKILFLTGTDFLACSYVAAKFLYGKRAIEKKKAQVVYNGIDYDKWDVEKINLKETKKKYSISDEVVLIFVGRMEEQKNPLFSLKVIQILRKTNNLKFIMVGQGSMLEAVKRYIEDNDMSNYVCILPADSDIVELQAISDIMVAPSLWEGLGIAYIEAQKMKTIVFASDHIPNEVDIGYCKFLKLDENLWADSIEKEFKMLGKNRIYNEKYHLFNVEKTLNNILRIYER